MSRPHEERDSLTDVTIGVSGICLKARIQRTLESMEQAGPAGAGLPVMPYTLAQGQDKLAQALPSASTGRPERT